MNVTLYDSRTEAVLGLALSYVLFSFNASTAESVAPSVPLSFLTSLLESQPVVNAFSHTEAASAFSVYIVHTSRRRRRSSHAYKFERSLDRAWIFGNSFSRLRFSVKHRALNGTATRFSRETFAMLENCTQHYTRRSNALRYGLFNSVRSFQQNFQ